MRLLNWLLLFIWFLAVTVAMVWSYENKTRLFDPESRLYEFAQSEKAEEVIAGHLTNLNVATQNTVIHITESGCLCNATSLLHRRTVAELAERHHFTNNYITITEEVLPFVPSTPAVLVYDSSGELLYLGPYSSGLFCTAGNGLVEPFITGLIQSQYNTVIPFDAGGCYCNRQ